MPIFICEHCKKEFKSRRKETKRRYCSTECFKLDNSIKVKCVECGKDFSIPKCRNGLRRFCSNNCLEKYYEKNGIKVSKKGLFKATNEYIIKNDTTILLITNTFNTTREVLIDTEDIDLVKKYKWRILPTNYVVGSLKRKQFKLHRVVMNCPADMVVDHINHDTLDNRKQNLRICTNAENQQNKISKNIRHVKQDNGKGKFTDYWKVCVIKDRKLYFKYFPYTKEGLAKAKEKAYEMKKELHPFWEENNV